MTIQIWINIICLFCNVLMFIYSLIIHKWYKEWFDKNMNTFEELMTLCDEGKITFEVYERLVDKLL